MRGAIQTFAGKTTFVVEHYSLWGSNVGSAISSFFFQKEGYCSDSHIPFVLQVSKEKKLCFNINIYSLKF